MTEREAFATGQTALHLINTTKLRSFFDLITLFFVYALFFYIATT